jgi:hypothetical protein
LQNHFFYKDTPASLPFLASLPSIFSPHPKGMTPHRDGKGSSGPRLRVGILITPSLSSESGKNELVSVDARRPWLRGTPPRHLLKDEDGDLHTTDDVSVGRYVRAKLGARAHVTLINPLAADAPALVRAQHVVFLLIYDVLEAFHTLPRHRFRRVQRLFREPNVFPAWAFQRLVNSKPAYFSFLRASGVPVLPFLHVSAARFAAGPSAAVDSVLRFAAAHEDSIICKPVFGQESIDFVKIPSPPEHARTEAHMEKMFRSYEGLVFQPFVESLERHEFRVFFFGEEPVYMLRTGDDAEELTMMTKDARGKYADIVRFAARAVAALPPATFRGEPVPRMLTRIDVACCFGDARWFVTEVEFVPSLFVDWTETMLDGVQVDALLGDAMLRLLHSDGFRRALTKKQQSPHQSRSDPQMLIPALLMLAVLIVLLALAPLLCF